MTAAAMPTPDEMLAAAERHMDEACRALDDALDWLRSDPLGEGDVQMIREAAARLHATAVAAKHAINEQDAGTGDAHALCIHTDRTKGPPNP